jgi:hypothetical protein
MGESDSVLEYVGPLGLVDHFDIEPGRPFRCLCGWVGPLADLETELFDALYEAFCPRCDKRLAVVQFPGEDDIRRAASKGNKEAQKMLRNLQEARGVE